MDMITQGLITAATFLWLCSYFRWRVIFHYAPYIDFLLTFVLMYLFIGTYAGMMTGVIAGLIISFLLRIGRQLLGEEYPRLIRRSGAIMPSVVMVRRLGRWSR